ncbi:MAG: hypothetical protein R3E77_10285 [Steroidobacteraceae bacterium]
MPAGVWRVVSGGHVAALVGFGADEATLRLHAQLGAEAAVGVHGEREAPYVGINLFGLLGFVYFLSRWRDARDGIKSNTA